MKIDASKNYYNILGVPESASESEIKKAFRKKSIELHPDKHSDKTEEERKNIEKQFAEVSEANDILSDKNKKQQYDQLRRNPFNGTGFNPFGGNGFSFNFGGFGFQQQNRPKTYPPGSDLNIGISLSLDDLYNYDIPKIVSYSRKVRCDKCNGIGGKGEKSCPECGGSGQKQTVHVQGNMQHINIGPCAHCSGTGKIIEETCDNCHGIGLKTIIEDIDIHRADIPKHFFAMDGGTINIPNMGNESRSPEMPTGQLHINISHVYNKQLFHIDENGNIYQNIDIEYYDAILGADQYTFTTFNNEYHTINVPSCSKDKTKIECTEMHGITPDTKYYIVLNIKMPNEIDSKEKKLLEKVKQLHENNK